MFEFLFSITIICFLFGIVYPFLAALIYPIYKILGGKMNFFEYMKVL